jgi:2-polyprenyl-3-methyl-5-hydroxy-6-metoxy-1,4-benzoquinol methylase
MGISTKGYNATDLDPKSTFERHVLHRDVFAHYLRWSFVLRRIGRSERVVDFGCGKGQLLETLYRNQHTCEAYFGFDIRTQTIQKTAQKFPLNWVKFYAIDLVKAEPKTFANMQMNADHVCSFEVVEHIGKQNIHRYLENFKACGNNSATYYLSTPNFDPVVGAAGNHTYDSGDGRGVQPQEFDHNELQQILQDNGFRIVEKYGTFASAKDYKHLMNEHQSYVFHELHKYYDSNLISIIMAPMFPEQSRNTVWVMVKS